MSARTALTGPAHIPLARVPPGSAGVPASWAPSIIAGGIGIQDTRVPYNTTNSTTGAGIVGWYGEGLIKTIAFVPSAASTTNLAAAQVAASGTPFTLATGTGITALSSAFLAFGSFNTIPVGAHVIDGVPTYTVFGSTSQSAFKTGFYNASGMFARAVSVTAAAGATGGTVTISGADVYGYPMTQTVTAVAGTTVNTLKAFKFIYSVTPSFTDGTHNYSVGTADVFGLPMFCDQAGDIVATWGGTTQTQATFTFVAGVTTSPSTAALGDVRGTWAPVSSASDGTKRLDLFQYVGVVRMLTLPTSLFGVAQI